MAEEVEWSRSFQFLGLVVESTIQKTHGLQEPHFAKILHLDPGVDFLWFLSQSIIGHKVTARKRALQSEKLPPFVRRYQPVGLEAWFLIEKISQKIN